MESFDQAIDAFWQWWQANEAELRTATNTVAGTAHHDELTEQVKAIQEHLVWGQGPDYLELSGEGHPQLRVVTQRWAERAPQRDDYHFYPAKQPIPPGSLASTRLSIAGEELAFADVLVRPEWDDTLQRIDLTLAHPVLLSLPDDTAGHIASIILDSAVGEDRGIRWIRTLKVAPIGEGAVPLAAFTHQLDVIRERWPAGPQKITGEGRTPDGGFVHITADVGLYRWDHPQHDTLVVVRQHFDKDAPPGRRQQDVEDGILSALDDARFRAHLVTPGQWESFLYVRPDSLAMEAVAAWAEREELQIEVEGGWDPAWEESQFLLDNLGW